MLSTERLTMSQNTSNVGFRDSIRMSHWTTAYGVQTCLAATASKANTVGDIESKIRKCKIVHKVRVWMSDMQANTQTIRSPSR